MNKDQVKAIDNMSIAEAEKLKMATAEDLCKRCLLWPCHAEGPHDCIRTDEEEA